MLDVFYGSMKRSRPDKTRWVELMISPSLFDEKLAAKLEADADRAYGPEADSLGSPEDVPEPPGSAPRPVARSGRHVPR
jgi:hypothetical protein